MVYRVELGIRWDHQVIFDLIPHRASVLDLGCGNGELLKRLIEQKNVWGLGVEKNIVRVEGCIENGVPVYHADIDHGLHQFPDNFFDYVILEMTLQSVTKPLDLLDEMLRLGKSGIVSFPNFGYKGVIESFVKTQRMPRTKALPYYWYDTPNIHLFTAKDFLDLVEEKHIKIEKGMSWIKGEIKDFTEEESPEAEEILFVVSRK
ncbi:MAG: methionine biosynthesis protein MetW [Clostridiales bacterium]|nr:methionine biosynthesis protein MetW [Clostridiales bacterium]